MGFGKKRSFWIKVCITTASYSILLNVTSIGFAKGKEAFGKVILYHLSSLM